MKTLNDVETPGVALWPPPEPSQVQLEMVRLVEETNRAVNEATGPLEASYGHWRTQRTLVPEEVLRAQIAAQEAFRAAVRNCTPGRSAFLRHERTIPWSLRFAVAVMPIFGTISGGMIGWALHGLLV